MKRVLVTGATGFIGRQAVQGLRESGYDVHASYSTAAGAETPDVQWHRSDLLAPREAARLVSAVRPTHLLHLAWYGVPRRYWTAAENVAWVQASLALLRAFAEHGGQRVVMAGSCAEYDWAHGYCSERVTPLKPATLYGTSKHALWLMLEAFSAQQTLSSAWGRVFFLYGPHEHPDRLVASIARALLAGQPAKCSHGEQIRDFLHVADVGDAFVAILESSVQGPINIASGRPVLLRDIVRALARSTGREDLVQFGAIPTVAGEPPLLVGDATRLRSEVGWRPRYGLEEGLDETLTWWRRTTGLARP